MNLSIFTVFLKNKNIIFEMRRSKVTDYAALTNFDNLRRNILEFVAIIEMNFATDGHALLDKRSLLMSLY